MLEFKRISPKNTEARALIAELDKLQISLYGIEYCHLDTVEELSQPHVCMYGAFLGGELVGIGAVKFFKDFGELKRMIVSPQHRGKGIARKIVQRLEQCLRDENIFVLRLETGAKQKEAQTLYKSLGYKRIEKYADYEVNHVSLYFEKKLEEAKEP